MLMWGQPPSAVRLAQPGRNQDKSQEPVILSGAFDCAKRRQMRSRRIPTLFRFLSTRQEIPSTQQGGPGGPPKNSPPLRVAGTTRLTIPCAVGTTELTNDHPRRSPLRPHPP